MKFIPILFPTPMVQAINEGRKTMTRRTKGLELLNDNPDYYEWLNEYPQIDIPRPAIPYDTRFYYAFTGKNNNSVLTVIHCPYGKPGDILWVKETHYAFGEWKKNGTTKTGKQKWKFERAKGFENIRFMDNKPFAVESPKFRGLGWYKKSSLFLEKKDCRTFLEITNIRVERLQLISDNDVKAEGAKDHLKVDEMKLLTGLDQWIVPAPFSGHQFGFLSIWCKINGCESWLENPFVWVISFKRIEKPEYFC